MKRLLLIFIVFINYNPAGAQQISSWSSFYENGFIWNPALTAKWNATETSVTHRRDWTGFDNSPEYTTIAFQFPFISRTHKRSSVGAYLDKDQVGPFKKVGFAATYAYGFSPRFMDKHDDVLTLGIKASFGRYEYDPTTLIAFDDVINNNITPDIVGNASISPNLGFGLFYNSVSDYYAFQKSHYYAGISFNQLVPIKALTLTYTKGDFLTLGDIISGPHATVHLGYRHIPFRRAKHYIEPNLMVIYAFKNAIHVMANVRYEKINKYWAAAGMATNGELFFQTGLIFDKRSFMKSIVKEGSLRLGVKADYNLGGLGNYTGVGYEFYGAYVFEVEN